MSASGSSAAPVALFTHRFLEPTHHAIFQILSGIRGVEWDVYARRSDSEPAFDLPALRSLNYYWRGPIDGFGDARYSFVHGIYDGRTAIRAARLAADAGYPYLMSFHGGFDTNAKIFEQKYRHDTLLAAQYSTAVTVVTQADVIRLREIGYAGRVEVIPVPLDLERAPRRIPARDLHLSALGRLVPKKGYDVLLRALARLPHARATIVGDGPERAALQEQAQQTNIAHRVYFTGELPLANALEIVAGSAVFVHPARRGADGNAEGTPQAILWAQAIGVPVVSTRTGSISDIIDDGSDGLLVEAEDDASLADAIVRAARHKRLAENARARVLAARAPAPVIEHWNSLYSEMLETREAVRL